MSDERLLVTEELIKEAIIKFFVIFCPHLLRQSNFKSNMVIAVRRITDAIYRHFLHFQVNGFIAVQSTLLIYLFCLQFRTYHVVLKA